VAPIRQRALGALLRLLPGVGQIVVLARFYAPKQLAAIRLPLGALRDHVLISGERFEVFVLSADGGWRHIALDSASATQSHWIDLAFAAFDNADNSSFTLMMACRHPVEKPRLARLQRSLLRASLVCADTIELSCNDALPGFRGFRIRPAPVWAMQVGAPPATQDSEEDLGKEDLGTCLPVEACDGPAIVCVEQVWREGGRCYVRGWAHADRERIKSLTIGGAKSSIAVHSFHPRPDLLQHYPAIPDKAEHAGFDVLLPAHSSLHVAVRVETRTGCYMPRLALPPRMPPDVAADWQEKTNAIHAFELFRSEINGRNLSVLEIGSRPVGSATRSSSDLFPCAVRRVGMDIHPGDGVDVVGDAHQLTQLFGVRAFDAIFSVATLEHLPMPWIVAAEINRVLRLGGLTYHAAPQCFPVHEAPNDFWRFTDEALMILFGPSSGFEVLRCGMADRMVVSRSWWKLV
jgi:hypothetical protein